MKFLSVKSARTVAILLTFINASIFIYAVNKYAHWVEIAAVNLIIQVLILVFYLLVHIYFVWLNEQMVELQNSFTHKTNAIDNRLKAMDGMYSDLSALVSAFREETKQHFQENSGKIINSVSEQSGRILKQNQEFQTGLGKIHLKTNEQLTELEGGQAKMEGVLDQIVKENKNTNDFLSRISDDFIKSNEQFTAVLTEKAGALVVKLEQLMHSTSENVQMNLKREIRYRAKENLEHSTVFTDRLNKLDARNSIALNQLYGLKSMLGSIQLEMLPELNDRLEKLQGQIAQKHQLQQVFEQLIHAYHEGNSLLNSRLEEKHLESRELSNKQQEEAIKLMNQLSSGLEKTITEVSPVIVHEIKPILEEIAEAKETKEVIFKQFERVNDSVGTQLNKLEKLNADLQKSTLQAFNIAFEEMDKLLNNSFADSNERADNRLDSLEKELEKAFELKLSEKIGELAKTSASEKVLRYLHEQLLQEVNSFRDKFINVTESFKEKSNALQTTVLDSNSSINKFEKFLAENRNESTTILQRIEKLDAAVGNKEESKLLRQFITAEMNSSYERIDSLFSIHNLLDINSPLPVMHEWRISSDFATHLVGSVLKRSNGNVLDIGSGVSTILAGYALKKKNAGKVFALEHSAEYYEKTLALIKEHGLEDFCNLYLCPLKKYKLDGKEWLWYDISGIELPENVILINVDGPPGATQPMARYPAVPILNNVIGKNTVILLDDGKREDERKIAEAWEEEMGLKKEYIKNYKGLYELTK